MQTLLTAQQAKQARSTVNLSQGKVANDLGLNRTYLSQFESGKYLFDDQTLESLHDYYSEHGWDTPVTDMEPQQVIHSDIRIKDGFVIPAASEEDIIELLLEDYLDNRRKIQKLTAQKVERGFFGGVNEEALENQLNQIKQLMAENYLIVEQLHGHNHILPIPKLDKDAVKDIVGDYLAEVFVS